VRGAIVLSRSGHGEEAEMHDGPVRRVVVGVDGSAPSRFALRAAAREARARDAELCTVIVADPAHPPLLDGAAGALDPAAGGPVLRKDAPPPWADLGRALVAAITEALGSAPDLRVHEHVEEGPVAEVLARFGADAELLVLGCHQRDGSGPVRPPELGAVVRACIWHARCPVVVVHPEDPEPATVKTSDDGARALPLT
jgi:nucleotide-binding universal stress UspA family protein